MPFGFIGYTQFILDSPGPPANYAPFPSFVFTECQFVLSPLASSVTGYFNLDASKHLICTVEGIYTITFHINMDFTATGFDGWFGFQVYKGDGSEMRYCTHRQAAGPTHSPGSNEFIINDSGSVTDYFLVGDQLHCQLGHDLAVTQDFFVTMNITKML